MLTGRPVPSGREQGFTLLATLVSVAILVFGLLALGGLLGKMQNANLESFQRAQAVLLVQDMAERISANRNNASSYVTGSTQGTGNALQSCGATASASSDLCQWSNALLGASEKLSSSAAGGLIGARGCITTVQAPDTSNGACRPGIYQVSVAWQGTRATVAPSDACGQNQYGGNDGFRRLISQTVTIGLPAC